MNIGLSKYKSGINIQDDYKIISIVKYLLALCVVCIHLTTSNAHVVNNTFGLGKIVYYILNICISRNFSRGAVPAFFFLSGYLYFINIKEYNITLYTRKTKNRIKTLLVPYVFWNVVMFAYLLIKSTIYKDVECPNFFHSLWYVWTDGMLYTPACGPMWFIRDLFFQVITIPLVFLILRRKTFQIIFLITVAILYSFNVTTVGFNPNAYLFFTVGSILGINGFCVSRFIYDAKKVIIPISFAVFAALVYCNVMSIHNIIELCIVKIWPFFFICIIFCFSIFINKHSLKIPQLVLNSTFFLYATHAQFVLEPLQNYGYKNLHLEENIWGVNGVYIATFLTAIIVAIVLSELVRHYIPKCLPIMTGGR